MKNLKLILIALFLINISINAQETEKTATIPFSQLTKQQLDDLKQKEMQKKAAQYGNWVGVGKEVGNAVKAGLESVVDVADKFTNTDVGKFTMFLVAWKVIGKDLIRISLGIILAIILTLYVFKSFRSMFVTKKILTKNPGLFKYPKEYKIINPIENYSYGDVIWYKMLLGIFLLGGYGITYAIMFG